MGDKTTTNNDKDSSEILNKAIETGNLEAFWEFLKSLFGTEDKEKKKEIDRKEIDRKVQEIQEKINNWPEIKQEEKRKLIDMVDKAKINSKIDKEVEKIEEEVKKIKEKNGIDLIDGDTMKTQKKLTDQKGGFEEIYKNKKNNPNIGNQKDQILGIIENLSKNQEDEKLKENPLVCGYIEQKNNLEKNLKELETKNNEATKIVEEITESERININNLENLENLEKEFKENKNTFEKAREKDGRKEDQIKENLFSYLKKKDNEQPKKIGKFTIDDNFDYGKLTADQKKEFVKGYEVSVGNDPDQGAKLNIALLEKLAVEAELKKKKEEIKNNQKQIEDLTEKLFEIDPEYQELAKEKNEKQINARKEQIYQKDPDYKTFTEEKEKLSEKLENRNTNFVNEADLFKDLFKDDRFLNEKEKTRKSPEEIAKIVRDDIKGELLNTKDDDNKLKEMFGIKGEKELSKLKSELFTNDKNGETTVLLDNLPSEQLGELKKYQENQAKENGIGDDEKAQAQRNATYLEHIAIPGKKLNEIEIKINQISQDPGLIADCIVRNEYNNNNIDQKLKENEDEIVQKINAHMDIGIRREQQIGKLQTQANPVPSGEDYIRKMAEIDAIENGAGVEEARKAAKQIKTGTTKGIVSSYENKVLEVAKRTINSQQVKINKCITENETIKNKISSKETSENNIINGMRNNVDNRIGLTKGQKQDKETAINLINDFEIELVKTEDYPDKMFQSIEAFKKSGAYKDASKGARKKFDKALESTKLVSNLKLYIKNNKVIEKCEEVSKNQYKGVSSIINKKMLKKQKTNLKENVKETRREEISIKDSKNMTREDYVKAYEKEIQNRNNRVKQQEERVNILKGKIKTARKKLKMPESVKLWKDVLMMNKSIQRSNYTVDQNGEANEATSLQRFGNHMENSANRAAEFVKRKNQNKGSSRDFPSR